jgi:Ni/Co efflux regulator RcnB
MKSKWLLASAFGFLLVTTNPVIAQDHDHGHGKGHDKHHGEDRDDDDNHDRGEAHYYRHHEDDIRGWYHERDGHLPPGLAKKDQLPPGLEKQLIRNGSLPPGLQKRLYDCPPDLERRLPPPPPDCAHVLIGGHIVLLNRKTNLVVDIFHLEIM